MAYPGQGHYGGAQHNGGYPPQGQYPYVCRSSVCEGNAHVDPRPQQQYGYGAPQPQYYGAPPPQQYNQYQVSP